MFKSMLIFAFQHQTMLESACCLLSYIGDILSALKQSSDRPGAMSPPYDGEITNQVKRLSQFYLFIIVVYGIYYGATSRFLHSRNG